MSGQVTKDAEHKTKSAKQYYTGITLHHNNTATNNTHCQPSNTIRRSIRRYISASDRPTWMERGGAERKGLQQPAKGPEGGLRGRKAELNAPARAAACLVLGRGHSRRYKYCFFVIFSFIKKLKRYLTYLLNTNSYYIRCRFSHSTSPIVCNICRGLQVLTRPKHKQNRSSEEVS